MPFTPLSSQNSDKSTLDQINNMFRETFAKDTIQLFKDDAGDRRVLLGKGANGFYGLKVSKPGFDVFTATDDDLIFNSDQNSFKIVSIVDITIPEFTTLTVPVNQVGYDTAETSVAHGLSSIPAFLAFILTSGDYQQMPHISYATAGDNIRWITTEWKLKVDATNVTAQTVTFLSALTAAGGVSATVETATVKVFLLQETVN